MADDKINRDKLLAPNTYMYMQNEGKNGMISVFVGPGVVNQTGQDKPIVYDQKNRLYRMVSLDDAVQQCPRAEEGDYVILENPADNNKFPTDCQNQSVPLQKGRKIVIPGPWSEALYPGQSATVVQGHRLRSNQYLVVTIYNEDEARNNWEHAVVKPNTSTGEGKPNDEQKAQSQESLRQTDFTVGQRIIIRGTEVSFYIPPTGVEVVQDDQGNYVREAVTLEQLEYCILVDEAGKKRFPRGPEVVFPSPTERFISDRQGNRKYKAMELNDIQGIHLKVTQAYEENGVSYKEGEELFLTGSDAAIYFPREEHAVIHYGRGNNKHFSTAIPKGEGRYVMDRKTGEIKTVNGPKMLLPDPRSQVIVRRILTDRQCQLWYPGNSDALAYNQNLRALSSNQPSSRSGFVSEGDYKKGSGKLGMFESYDSVSAHEMADYESVGATHLPQKMERELNYKQPQLLTLDTKFDGVPTIRVYTGYAVNIISKSGDRRVVVGPATVLLHYDEILEELTLSTGKPKTTDHTLSTCYLRVLNNKISDYVEVETSDHVKALVKLSLCVDFEGSPEKWFDVENYVKFLTDHVRSLLKGAVKKISCRDFYSNYLSIIRDTILRPKQGDSPRQGLIFPQNGMRVTEVEVLDQTIIDREVSALLDTFQKEVVKQDINLDQARKTLEVTQITQQIKTETADAVHKATMHALELAASQILQERELEVAKIEAEIAKIEKKQAQQTENEKLFDISSQGKLAREKSESEQSIAISTAKQSLALEDLNAQTEAACKRLAAAKENLSEALLTLGRQETLVQMSKALSVDAFISGHSLEGAFTRVFAGLPFAQELFEKIKGNETNGRNRLNQPATGRS